MNLKAKLTKAAVALTAALFMAVNIPMADVSAAFGQENMFQDSSNVKGIQGVSDKGEKYGTSHRLINLNIMDCYHTPDEEIFALGYILPYRYKGKDYCLTIPDAVYYAARYAKEHNESLSIVFLMQWSDKASWLIDDEARDGGGHTYYAPEGDGEAGEWLEAFFSFLCKEMAAKDYQIDNFILGNEVNMPNHWHYSGTTDVDACTAKYAAAFRHMYNAVREYSSVARCSVSLDHSWNHNDEGRGIAARDFLHSFAAKLDAMQPGINWCVSTHLYPAILYDTAIWNSEYNGLSQDAQFIDGKNLYYMTNYIRENFGESHRVMLTEQGFCDDNGAEVQAAALAYSYYAAMYDPMVDCFLLNTENAGSADGHSLNFEIEGTLAGEVYQKIGNGNPADQEWIASVCLPVIGVDSWSEIIPYYPGSGIVNPGLNGLHLAEDGNWYYYVNDNVVTDYTGLVCDDKLGWWYVENGRINFDYNGFSLYNDTWWCVAGGRVVFDYTGLWCDPSVGWWYVENGAINFNYSGLKEYGGNWWCVAGGRVVFDYTGLWCDPYVGWWYVENGKVNFNYNGLKEYGGAWWCVAGGRIVFDYTGLWYDSSQGWWYVENGAVNFDYDGLVPDDEENWWCVANGTVAFDYTGLWSDAYVGWWYVENGSINFNYTGLITENGVDYAVQGGRVIF